MLSGKYNFYVLCCLRKVSTEMLQSIEVASGALQVVKWNWICCCPYKPTFDCKFKETREQCYAPNLLGMKMKTY